MSQEAGPSKPSLRSLDHQEVDLEDDEEGYGLDDLLPEPESPLTPPYSFSTYTLPKGTRLPIPDGRDHLILRLVGSHPLWGHHLWNTARVFSDYLLANPSLTRNQRILELGAGAGLPGFIAALTGAKQVTITDYPDHELVENISWNVKMNLSTESLDRVKVEGFVWGKDPKPLLGLSGRSDEGTLGYDLLILSDLVFNHSQHSALVSSVNSLISPEIPSSPSLTNPTPTPSILVFFTHHRPRLAQADLAFFPLLARSGPGWAYQKVVEEWAGVMFEEDPGDERVRGTVHGWRCWRITEGEVPGERPDLIVRLPRLDV